MATGRMIAHRVRCLICGDTLETWGSKERIECSCDEDSGTRIFIAGGTLRPVLGYGYKSEYEDISVIEESK